MSGQTENNTQGNWMSTPAGDPEPAVPEMPIRRKSKSVSKNNLVLAGLFIGGIAVIGLLHFKAGPKSASAASTVQNAQVDTLLAALTEVKKNCRNSSSAGAIVNQFYYDSHKRQIPPGELASNPFCMVLPQAQAASSNPATAVVVPDQEALALSEAKENVRDLSLQSVLTGSSGATAMISNNVLTVGQQIRGWTVVEIAPRQVVLEWKSHRHILTMK